MLMHTLCFIPSSYLQCMVPYCLSYTNTLSPFEDVSSIKKVAVINIRRNARRSHHVIVFLNF